MSDTIVVRSVLPIGTPTKNGNVYTEECIRGAIEGCNYSRTGQIGMLNTFLPLLSMVSHSIDCLRVVNDQLCGDLTILDTPQGNELQQLLDKGVKIAYRPAVIVHDLEKSKIVENGIEREITTINKCTLVAINAVPEEDAA